ncbi:ROK family transcriptional regulator [Streptomyces hoynatensis]|uniref:ROK family transcriptional regulator n=1 Tax=Streptomyces hoynatensis TaxID=1141874 RepID=UPI00131A095B|nr:ROK family transcriptional regulator [Streptomyces hoynatensis]
MGAAGSRGGRRPAPDAWRAVPETARPILRELVLHGPQSRTALARSLGLSPGSLTRLTKPLVEAGLVVERGAVPHPVSGRPTRPLEVVADDLHFVGVTLTSSHVYGVLTNLRADVVARESAPLADLAPETVIAQIGEVAERLSARGRQPVAIGLGMGGNARTRAPVGEGELIDSGLLGWEQVPVSRMASERLGIPCTVRNDVTALAYSHLWSKQARGLTDFAMVTVGDGLGYALFLGGRAVRLTEAAIGDFGHQILTPDGPMCPAGHCGCAGAYLTKSSLMMTAAQGMRRFPTYSEVLELAGAGDRVCARAVQRAAWALGVLIANVVNNTGVRTLVLAGEAIDVARVARPELERGLAARHRNPEDIELTVQAHDFHDWARGAAVVAIRRHISDH